MKADNENEPSTFETLAAATVRVLEKQQSYKDEEQCCGEHAAEQKEKQHREYIARRLRELAAFEARARGRR